MLWHARHTRDPAMSIMLNSGFQSYSAMPTHYSTPDFTRRFLWPHVVQLNRRLQGHPRTGIVIFVFTPASFDVITMWASFKINSDLPCHNPNNNIAWFEKSLWNSSTPWREVEYPTTKSIESRRYRLSCIAFCMVTMTLQLDTNFTVVDNTMIKCQKSCLQINQA